MRLHREGIRILTGSFIVFLLITILVHFFLMPGLSLWFVSPLWVLFGFMIYFFRNPERVSDSGPLDVIAPVDGTVVAIKEVQENEFLKTTCIQISIFMSPLNVHVTRYPVNGKVIFKKYHPGKYLVAFHPKSSELNERTTVAVETQNGAKVLFRQIAGAVARRIVIYSNEGDMAEAGNEYGFIKFGSRLDVFLPLETEIFTRIGARTKGGIQKIAELK